MNRLLLPLCLLIFLGCEEKFPVYKQFCQTETKPTLTCLRYDALMDKSDQNRIEKALGFKHDPNCKNLLQLTKYYVGECNNPLVKSIGGDFNGYVRIQINRGMKCYYKVQSDFKNDMQAAYERVLIQSQKDLKN